jgi:hypothetical protein
MASNTGGSGAHVFDGSLQRIESEHHTGHRPHGEEGGSIECVGSNGGALAVATAVTDTEPARQFSTKKKLAERWRSTSSVSNGSGIDPGLGKVKCHVRSLEASNCTNVLVRGVQ